MMHGKGSGTIRLVIDSSLKDVFLMGLAAKSFCAFTPLPKDLCYLIELCVIEAVTNAVKHAYLGQPDHEVDLIVSMDPQQIKFQVCDTGIAMKSLEEASMDFDPEDHQSVPEGGMGLFIIQTVMDDVTYETVGETNILTMRKLF